MTKENIEQTIEDLFVRLCAGVISHNAEFRFDKTFSGHRLTKYNILCHASDGGRILGQRGDRFKALKLLMRAAGAKLNHQIVLETMIAPNETGVVTEIFPPFRYNVNWPKESVTKLLQDICDATFKFPVTIEAKESIGSCIFIVCTNKQEAFALVDSIATALQNIFGGIGTANGCQLTVDVD